VDPAIQSMIDNLPANTGRSLEEWFAVLDTAGLDKHGEMLAHLKNRYGVSHGYANGIVLQYRARGTTASDDDLVDAQYAGARAGLRPIYEALVSAVREFGDDVTLSPKKASVSLRRSKQFALVEPASAKRVQLGINLKDAAPTDRLQAATGMCTHKVSVTDVKDVDPQLVAWLKQAYDLA
jgi:predicted transport protein